MAEAIVEATAYYDDPEVVAEVSKNLGDEVVIPAPYWVSYPSMVILAGGKPVIVPTRQEDDFKLKVEDLEAAFTPRTRALILNSPNNPTGSAYIAEEMAPLAQACAQRGVLIISDEIYEPILFDGLQFTSTAALGPEIFENTITLNGVSKAYAMTGWRIGYMGGPQDLIKACAKIQSQSTSNPCSIAQKAALAALNGPQDQVAAMNAEFQKRRDYIMGRIAEIPDAACPYPRGAFYAMPNLSAYFGKKAGDRVIANSVDLSGYLLETGHVATVAGAAFGEDRCIRLSFATSMELITEGMNRIQDALSKLA
jgi:aspartate aminotransferase